MQHLISEDVTTLLSNNHVTAFKLALLCAAVWMPSHLRQPTCRHGNWPEQKGLSLLSNDISHLAAVFVSAC